MPKFPFAEWRAQQLRLTAFPTPNATYPTVNWWQRMTDTEPSESTTDRRRNFSLDSGEYGGGTLSLHLAPERIEWHLTAQDGQIDRLSDIGDLGSISESLNTFLTLAERWLSEEDIPDISRLAFGAVLLHPEADLAAGYNRLRDYIPLLVDSEWRDFLFQVNVRAGLPKTEYAIEYLNRLSRWSVGGLRAGQLTISAGGFAATGVGTVKFALRLELDINTPAEFVGAIPRPQLVRLFQESTAAVQAIAKNGITHE